MKLAAVAVVFALSAATARANTDDTTTLLIENGTAAVTQVEGMTQRECDAAVRLLSARKPDQGSSGIIVNGSGYYVPPPPTSKLSAVKCVRPSDK